VKLSVEQACPFCGQFIAIGIDEDTPEEERAALAKAKCGCPQAARERDIQEAMDKLEQICGADAMNNGFDYPLDDETMEICRRMIGYLIDEAVGEVQLRCVRGDRLKLKSDGKIVRITRKCQKQMVL
jgi:hypothetical protein